MTTAVYVNTTTYAATHVATADRIVDRWPDPADFGPDISDVLDGDQAKMRRAQTALREAEAARTRAILLDRQGKTGEALSAWRSLFGDLFPLS